MRLGFVTQWFPPEPGTFIARDIAVGLAGRGHDVHVVTGFPNYPDGVVQEGYSIRPYLREELSPGVHVHRAALYPSHDSSAGKRIANYLSFAAGAAAAVASRVPRPDAWLVYSSPATAAIPAMVVPGKHAPTTLLIQDLWPDSVTGSSFLGGRTARLADRLLGPACSAGYRQAAAIGVISPSMRDLLVSRGVPGDKIHDTPNWVSDDHLLPELSPGDIDRQALGLPEGRLFMYAGNLGDLQGLDAVVDGFLAVPHAQLVLVGDGVAKPRLMDRVRRAGATHVTFVDRKGPAEVGRYLAAADIHVVSLQDTPLLRATMPSKVQTALACGRPTLACVAGDAAALVEHSRVGIAASPGDSPSIATAIKRLVDMPSEQLAGLGVAARRTYLHNFSPSVGVERLASVIESTTSQGAHH